MAWEEESIESGVDFDDGGGKKSFVKIAIIAVVVVALGAAAYFAYTKFLAGDDSEETAAEDGNGDAAADQPAEELPPPEVGFKVDLEKFTLNLSGGDARYLVCTIALEVSTEELKLMLEESENSLQMVKTRDAIIQIMRAKTVEEVRDPAALREIANEIKFKLSRLYAEGDVMNVYFSEFLID